MFRKEYNSTQVVTYCWSYRGFLRCSILWQTESPFSVQLKNQSFFLQFVEILMNEFTKQLLSRQTQAEVIEIYAKV